VGRLFFRHYLVVRAAITLLGVIDCYGIVRSGVSPFNPIFLYTFQCRVTTVRLSLTYTSTAANTFWSSPLSKRVLLPVPFVHYVSLIHNR
jgi:hypothetical protein